MEDEKAVVRGRGSNRQCRGSDRQRTRIDDGGPGLATEDERVVRGRRGKALENEKETSEDERG